MPFPSQNQQLQALKYVQVESIKSLDLSLFPDFLLLGPQRTGSTWLAENLRLHPEIFFTSPKEIYFFNLLKLPDHPFYRSNQLEWYLQCFSDSPTMYIKKTFKSLINYQELYRPRIRGEGTASYAVLNQDIIREVALINPKVKAILTIRNPISRAWSHAKKDLLNDSKRSLEDVSEQEFIAYFHQPYQLSCARYIAAIDQWLKFLPPDQFLTIIFDDIVERPHNLLLQTFQFLGVSSRSKYVDEKISKTRIARTDPESQNRDLPHHYREILSDLFADELAHLEVRLGRRPQY
jgi:hypothetical protein